MIVIADTIIICDSDAPEFMTFSHDVFMD